MEISKFSKQATVGGIILSSAFILFSKSKQNKKTYKLQKRSYQYHMKRSFEKLGLKLYGGYDWEKILENSKKIEALFNNYSIIVTKINEYKTNSYNTRKESKNLNENERFLLENQNIEKVFYGLLFKYSLFSLNKNKIV